MYDEQTRINATISYLFLGPIFLLAKKDTPLAEKYVQDHAKRASLLIVASLGVYVVYYFLRDILSVSLFGISIASVVLAIIVTLTLAILLHGAYFAFSGREADSLRLGDTFTGKSHENHILDSESTDASGYSEEEKIRIIAAFLPFVGIWLASRYDKEEIQIGKKIGSSAVALIMLASIVTGSAGLAMLVSLVYIGIIVVTLVGLFVQKQFFALGVYRMIPTYHEFETHVFASVKYLALFVRVIFGGNKDFTYELIYSDLLDVRHSRAGGNLDSETSSEGQTQYFMPLWIVGIPLLNLITLPSFFNSTYVRYKNVILQGITLTLLFVLIGVFYGWNSSLETILLFPIVHLMSFAGKDPTTRAPIVSIGISIAHLFGASRANITELAKKEEKVSFSYEAKTEEAEEKIASL